MTHTFQANYVTRIHIHYRDAEGGEAGGGHVPPQVLRYQLTLFGPRGADYARHITTGPPIFLDDAASLLNIYLLKKYVKYYSLSFNFLQQRHLNGKNV